MGRETPFESFADFTAELETVLHGMWRDLGGTGVVLLGVDPQGRLLPAPLPGEVVESEDFMWLCQMVIAGMKKQADIRMYGVIAEAWIKHLRKEQLEAMDLEKRRRGWVGKEPDATEVALIHAEDDQGGVYRSIYDVHRKEDGEFAFLSKWDLSEITVFESGFNRLLKKD